MNKLLIATTTALLIASLPASADIRWDYIGAGYTLSLIHISEPTRPY